MSTASAAGGLDISVTKVFTPSLRADQNASVPESSGICTSMKARSMLEPFSRVRQSRPLSVVLSRSGSFDIRAASVRSCTVTWESSAMSIVIGRGMRVSLVPPAVRVMPFCARRETAFCLGPMGIGLTGSPAFAILISGR